MELKHRLLRDNMQAGRRFNRTFMELKLRKSFTSTFVITVLIGPSWNWNALTGSKDIEKSSFNRTFMELKHDKYYAVREGAVGFNRTFMELKHIHAQFRAGKHARFNRTFMELKLLCAVQVTKRVFLF